VIEEAGDVAAPGTGTAIPAHAADIQTIDYSYTLSGAGECVAWSRNTQRNPKSCAISVRRRPIPICGATSALAPGHGGELGSDAERWRLTTTRREYFLPPLHHGHRLPLYAKNRLRSMESRISRRDHFTGRWPHEEVKLAGKRIAVIGHGIIGHPVDPVAREQAVQLTVFQRTPNFALPATTVLPGGPPRHAGRRPRRLPRAGALVAGRRPLSATDGGELAIERCNGGERFEQAWATGDLVYILTSFWTTRRRRRRQCAARQPDP